MTLRALFLHRDLPFHAGVPQSILTLARSRDRSRLSMAVATLEPADQEIHGALKQVDVAVFELGRSYPVGVVRLRRLIRQLGLDVVVCTSFKSFVIARIACTNCRCRAVFWIPSVVIMKDVARRNVFRVLARNATLTFISQAVANTYQYSWHRGATSVIYYGIDSAIPSIPASPTLRTALGIPDRATVFGYVAEFTPWKQHPLLLDAFDQYSARHPSAHLVLIGTGSTLEQARGLVETLDCRGHVHFLGARTDVRTLFSQMDVYVHPANGEGFGLAVAEAMLSGVPVVVADSGALPEFVHHEATGLLFEPTSKKALVDAMSRIQGDAELRQSLSVNAMTYCREHFSTQRFATEMTDMLEAEVTMR